jgi:hypothetical protein
VWLAIRRWPDRSSLQLQSVHQTPMGGPNGPDYEFAALKALTPPAQSRERAAGCHSPRRSSAAPHSRSPQPGQLVKVPQAREAELLVRHWWWRSESHAYSRALEGLPDDGHLFAPVSRIRADPLSRIVAERFPHNEPPPPYLEFTELLLAEPGEEKRRTQHARHRFCELWRQRFDGQCRMTPRRQPLALVHL